VEQRKAELAHRLRVLRLVRVDEQHEETKHLV